MFDSVISFDETTHMQRRRQDFAQGGASEKKEDK